MSTTFGATSRRGFGAFPLTLGANLQIARIIESSLVQRVDIRTITASTIPGMFALEAPNKNCVLPLWVFRGSSSDSLGNLPGIGVGVESDPILGQQAMPSAVPPSLETLYLGYIALQSVNGGTLRFPRGSLTARGGQFLAAVTLIAPVDLTLTPPAQFSDPVTLTVLGTKERIGDIHSPSVAGKYLASLPRY